MRFYVNYDKLAICTGAQGSTFGIKGVSKYAHFLRDVRNAEAIRNRLIENWSLANVPGGVACVFWLTSSAYNSCFLAMCTTSRASVYGIHWKIVYLQPAQLHGTCCRQQPCPQDGPLLSEAACCMWYAVEAA